MSSFELHIPDTNVQDGSAPISWCMHPDFVSRLVEAHVEDPYVYLIVTPCADEHRRVKERRYAVPLRDMMAYVEFGSPGVNHVFAFVAGEKEREDFLKGDRQVRWNVPYMDLDTWREPEEGEEKRIGLYASDKWQGATRIMVMVPTGVFAKEPPAWLAKWVNWCFDLPPIDSCEFQRRMYGFALHLQVLFFLAVYGVRLVSYVVMKSLLLGNVSARPLLQPLTFNVDDLQDTTEGDGKFHFLPRTWLKGKDWAYWYMLSTPFVAAIIAMIVWTQTSFLVGLMTGTVWALSWASLVSVVALAAKGAAMLREKLDSSAAAERKRVKEQQKRAAALARKEEERRAEQERLFWYKDPNLAAPLVCTPETPRQPLAKVADLPPELRTWHLRLAEYKAGSCKPYAK